MIATAAPTLNATLSASDEKTRFQHSSVLIVDDDPVYRMMLRKVCHDLGIGHIAEAPDGIQALASTVLMRPDLILLDILMPGMDGIEVCRRLRSMPVIADTAILLQTAVADEARKVEGFAAGATDYITKPLAMPEFTARVKTHLGNALHQHSLASFRQRLDEHLTVANDLLTALLPDHSAAHALAARNGFELSIVQQVHEEVGGDLWYVRELEAGKLLIILLDANKAGLAGACNALRIDAVLRELWRGVTDPGKLLHELDRAMASSPCGRLFASVTAMVFDHKERSAWYTASGNPYPIFVRGRQAASLVCGGLPLGSGMATLDLHHLSLSPDDVVVLHSDGWPQAAEHNPLEIIQGQAGTAPLSAAMLHDPALRRRDDTTIISLRYL